MDETAPIRKVISGKSINTETDHCFHSVIKVMSEQVDGQLQHRYIVQSLYQNSEGGYFLAFWNKLNWNDESLSYDFVDDAILIEPEQAKQWMRSYCPENLESFVADMDKACKPASMQTLTLRMRTELRDYLASAAKSHGQSLNKICLELINTGMSANRARPSLFSPQPYYITMPDGKPAVDEFEKALKFDDPSEQELAGYAESLYGFYRFEYPFFLPFALKTLYILIHADKNESHALCFANWLSRFHRVSFSDNLYPAVRRALR
jgi:hypothetical protein